MTCYMLLKLCYIFLPLMNISFCKPYSINKPIRPTCRKSGECAG